jgi:hypothetical protein
MLDLLSSNNIIELIDSNEEGYNPNDTQTLIYKNIFPYLRVPKSQSKAMTNILIAVDKLGKLSSNPTFCKVRVTIWIISHQEHMYVKNRNGNRIDLISDEIERLFRGSRKYGFSEIDDFPNYEKLLNDSFVYREITFVTDDTVKPTCGIRR